MIFEYVLELIKAIVNQDLPSTQKYVQLINESPEGETSMPFVTMSLNIHDNPYHLDNECFDYVLDNLLYLNNSDIIKLQRKKSKLLLSRNVNDIKSFIISQIENPTYKVQEGELLENLLQLTTTLKDRNEINEILQLIKNKFLINSEEV